MTSLRVSQAVGSFCANFTLKKVYDMVSYLSKERVSMLLGVDEEIRKLIDDLKLIQKFLDEVEQKHITQDALQGWLQDLKDLVYDAEDVLEEFLTAVAKDPSVACSIDTDANPSKWGGILGIEVKKGFSQTSNLVKSAMSSRTTRTSEVRLWIADKIKAIRTELDILLNRKEKLNLSVLVSNSPAREQSGGQRSQRPQVGSRTEYKFKMVGREKEQKELVDHLIGTHTASSASKVRSNVSVISIVGKGGVGKSTLAQLVYQEVGSQFTFSKWLSVGEKFDPESLIQKLNDKTTETQLSDLQDKLIEKLSGKKFLIVLDDVWNKSPSKWRDLWTPLSYGSEGSRVLITCRDRKVVKTTGFKPTIDLQPLTNAECLTVFLSSAFPNGGFDDHPHLKCTAKKIVAKLKGLPLAAKVVGSSLFDNFDEDKWNIILKDELWASSTEGDEGIMDQLKWSYNLMPSHLKQCFGYCSIFPKDYEFDIQHDLILKWVAAGLVQPDVRRRLEDIGKEYFDDLLQMSFFDHINGTYKMHDLIHDLAELVSFHECAGHDRKWELDRSAASSVRHLSLHEYVAECPYDFQKVRTVFYYGNRMTSRLLPDGFFSKLKYIRVLDLGITLQFSDHIVQLIHLRYLKLRVDRDLPESIGNLCNLQVLIVTSKYNPEGPIRGVSNLSKLRYLDAKEQFVTQIESIGRLTDLQYLRFYTVQTRAAGYGIEELQNLRELRGHLCIKNLNGLQSREEANRSNLKGKEHLTKLSLLWKKAGIFQTRDDQTLIIHEEVLNGLQPNPKLHELNIENYEGRRLPSWFSDANSLSNLMNLSLSNCESLESLPSLGQLNCLLKLNIQGFKEVKTIGNEFYGDSLQNKLPFRKLDQLKFVSMYGWEKWLGEGWEFPSLRHLWLEACDALEGLPRIFGESVRHLDIVGLKTCRFDITLLEKLKNLRRLRLEECPEVSRALCEYITSSVQQDRTSYSTALPCLESLTLDDAQLFSTFLGSGDWFCKASSIQELSFVNSQISSDTNPWNTNVHSEKQLSLFSSLKKLVFKACVLYDLPSYLHFLPSLEVLEITSCVDIKELPETGLPKSLQHLSISECPTLIQRCTEGGPDWEKIANIPQKSFC